MRAVAATQKVVPAESSPRPGPSRREDQVAERRRTLLDATLAVIARKGLTGVTISDIASEAQCSFGVVSFHFKSKDGIVLAALDHIVERYDRTLNVPPPDDDNPAGRLRVMLELDFNAQISGADSIAVFSAFWAESVRNPEYRRRCAELKGRYDAVVEADVAALARQRGIDLDPALVARSLNAMIDGFWISNQVHDTVGAEGLQLAKNACLFYLKSIFPQDF